MVPIPSEVTRMACDYCYVEFFPHEGGLCAQCRKPFCAFDLYTRRDDTAPYCMSCRTDRQATLQLSSPAANPSLWARRRLSLTTKPPLP